MARRNPDPRLIAWRTREFVNLALTHLQALYGVEFVIVPIDDITAVNSMRRMVTIAPANRTIRDMRLPLTDIADPVDALCGNDPDLIRTLFEDRTP